MSAKIGLRDWARVVINDQHYTPDLVTLQSRYTRIPVFVYGTEQYQYSDEAVMQEFPRLGVGFLPTNDYLMYQTQEHQPFVLYKPGEGYCVRGEIYAVPPRVISAMDMKNVNGIFVRRSLKTVHWYLTEQKEQKDKQWFSTECFVWLGIAARMQFMIDNNSAVRKDTVSGKDGRQYFHFRKGDDQANRVSNHRRAL